MCGSQNVQGGFYAVLFGRYNITGLKRRSGRGGGEGSPKRTRSAVAHPARIFGVLDRAAPSDRCPALVPVLVLGRGRGRSDAARVSVARRLRCRWLMIDERRRHAVLILVSRPLDLTTGQKLRIKTVKDSPFIETVGIIDTSSKKTALNFAGAAPTGDTAGEGWTDKLQVLLTSTCIRPELQAHSGNFVIHEVY